MMPGFTLSPAEMAALAARASYPEERLAPPFIAAADAQQEIDARIARWRDHAAKGNDPVFRRVLGWRGIDLDRLRPGLGPVRLAPGADLPAWVLRFAEIAARAADTPPRPSLRGPLPALFAPFAAAAAADMHADWDARGVAPAVRIALEDHLAATLAETCGPALRGLAQESAALQAIIALGTRPVAWSDIDGGAAAFFRHYPVLARLVTLQVQNWQAMIREFLDRLDADRPALAARFFAGTDPGPVTEVTVENADAHDGGRVVMLVGFAGGGCLVYKPRSLALDIGFERLVDWLRQQDPALGLRVPRALDRGDYGWCSFIAHGMAADEAAAALFYRHAGQLLALAYALDGGDLHHENLIANGSALVPIDLETVLQPRLTGNTDGEPSLANHIRLALLQINSVLQTGMVPTWVRAGGRHHVDIGGLGDPGIPGTYPKSRATTGAVEPVLARHAADIAQGFADLYRQIVQHRAAILAPDGPLGAMAGCPVRYLFRDTRIYIQILRRSLAGDSAVDGADFDIGLERLARALCLSTSEPVHVPLVDAEKAALRAGDVPRFRMATDATDVADQDGLVVPAMLDQSALDRARRRIAALSPDDLARQLRFLGMALQSRIAGADGPAGDAAPPPVAAAAPARAAMLAGAIDAARCVAEPGFEAWIDLRRDRPGEPLAVSLGDPSFGYGLAGIAVFRAACARLAVAPAEDARLDSLLAGLWHATEDRSRRDFYRAVAVPLGIATGLGGLAYAAAAIARITGRADAQAQALALGLRLTPDAIMQESEPDLHAGLAGGAVALAALYRFAPRLDRGERLTAVVERLVALASEPVLAAMPAGGVLGGAAGVALAAMRLEELVADPRLRVLAARALRLAKARPGQAGWGSGAAGILLVRAFGAGRGLCDVPEADAGGVPALHTLADGLAGTADAFAEAGRRLAAEPIQRRGAADFARLLGTPAYRCFALPVPGAMPAGLFHGAAGIGYQLLRDHRPGLLPNLLLFD